MNTIQLHTNQQQSAWPADYYHTLHRRLRRMMEEEMAFTDASITRKKLADALYTNQMYLAVAIRQFYNRTYTEYLTDLRLRHALRLMRDTVGHPTIESVAADAGFGSRWSFYRQFKARFGVSPEGWRASLRT